jgi:hypothetical protein
MVRYPATSMDKPEPTRDRNGMRWLVVFSALILPHILISLPRISKLESRPLTLGTLFIASGIGLCWYGLDPRSRILGPGALHNKVIAARLFMVVLGIIVFSNLGIPFATASVRVARGQKPIEVAGTIERNGGSAFGAWFFLQSVTLSPDGGRYQLYYSLTPLRVGESYELEMLPNSHLVLDFHKLS